jgi:ribosome silencing factor RsfS/YbeB/iojap
MTLPTPDSLRRAGVAAQAAAEKKAADNVRQVRSIVEEIELTLKITDDEAPRAVEGMGDASWVLMDYGDVIVHVFLTETREFYDLDNLWADASPIAWQATASSQHESATPVEAR